MSQPEISSAWNLILAHVLTKKKLSISRNWDEKADWNISWQSLGTIKSKLIDNITSVRKLPICFKKLKIIKIIIKNTARKRLGAFFIMTV